MKMKKYTISIFLILLLVSCGKKYKEPTDLELRFDINKAPTVDGQLTFSEGHFIMNRIDFEGKREKGDDVSFSRSFDNGLTIPFDLNTAVPDLNFMVPQGVYTELSLAFDTKEEGASPCILVDGTYTYSGGGTVPMRFEFDDSEEYEVEAEAEDGGQIVLDADLLSRAKVVLDPTHWFQVVPTSHFESASLTDVDGTMTMLINKNKNEEIFDLILDRIDESTEAVFNY